MNDGEKPLGSRGLHCEDDCAHCVYFIDALSFFKPTPMIPPKKRVGIVGTTFVTFYLY